LRLHSLVSPNPSEMPEPGLSDVKRIGWTIRVSGAGDGNRIVPQFLSLTETMCYQPLRKSIVSLADYDLGYIELEAKTLQPNGKPHPDSHHSRKFGDSRLAGVAFTPLADDSNSIYDATAFAARTWAILGARRSSK